jgi:glycosyltransferase involved in cell wall biosynthesis
MEERSLITFALFSYNQDQFIKQAVQGALSQTYSPLEIILSDDCSSDRTFDIMQRMAREYAGPHRIVLNRNDPNLGLCAHVNKLFEMAAGEIVVLAAGDDISLPNRALTTWETFSKNKDAMAVSMQYISIDRSGNVLPDDSRKRVEGKYGLEDYGNRARQPISGSALAYRKSVFEYFGPLTSWCQAEDAALVFRSLLIGSAYHVNSVGTHYRKLESSLSTIPRLEMFHSIYRQNTRDFARALSLDDAFVAMGNMIRRILRNMLARATKVFHFHAARRKLAYYICNILPSALFSANEKFLYLKISIVHALKQTSQGN